MRKLDRISLIQALLYLLAGFWILSTYREQGSLHIIFFDTRNNAQDNRLHWEMYDWFESRGIGSDYG